jgi:2-haloalkanoic acid dehalogenase type II
MDFDVITFDCYGTLIDWESGIREAFRGAGFTDGETVLEQYAKVEPAVQRQGYRRYREILGDVAGAVARALGRPAGDTTFLAESLPDWKPFPETNRALERLQATGLTLGILSNIDDDLLAATRRHFTVDFEIIVTAQQVSSYKPGRAHFDAARKLVGDRRWLHAAQSNFHDIVPANSLGVATAWINRHGQKPLPGGQPSMEFRDLDGLAARLA